MAKRIFLIHGWGGSPDKDWLPWARKELTQRGCEVIAPLMPDTGSPVIQTWVDHLIRIVGVLRHDDIFIGHSIGCQTILRYLERGGEGKCSRIILIAPWFTLTNLENDEMWHVAGPWLNEPIDCVKIKLKVQKIITIFSDNDPWVPYTENKKMFADRLNAVINTLHSRGHITAEEGSSTIPELLPLLD